MALRPAEYTELELLTALDKTESTNAAVQFIYREYLEGFRAYIIGNGGESSDAEDLFQDSLVGLIDAIRQGRFRGESSLKTYLFSIGRHLWLNELKRRGRAQIREQKFENSRDTNADAQEEQLVKAEERLLLQKVVAKLGETCQQILLLFYYENLSMKEILDQTHYENEQVLRNKKYKCMKELEKMMREQPALVQQLKNSTHG